MQTRKPFILSRKLPAGFRDNTGSFRVRIRVLPTSIHYQAKQPQNRSSYPH